MLQRALYLLKTYVLTVLFFMAAKVAFMCSNATGHPFTAGDVMDVVIHGATLDLSTALYFLIVPFLCCVASVFLRNASPLRRLLKAYYVLVAVAFALAFVADSSLYAFWHFKLDASCLQYLDTPTEAMASVSAGYLLARAVLVAVQAWVMYQAYTRPRWNILPGRHRVAESVTALVCIPLMVIGIRGGLDESTTNVGQVYFSQNQFLNHASVNPVFSFLASFENTANEIVDYDFFTQEECDRIMDGLYPTSSEGTDTLLNDGQPNIVIILMESAGEVFADVMPHLNRLKQQGVSFSNCYANSWRTDRGTVCALSGYPSFPISSVMKMPKKTRVLPGIAAALQQQGYVTHYLYGGDINFTNMRSYLISTGFSELTWKKDYTAAEQRTADWGVRDDITFATLLSQIGQAPAAPGPAAPPHLFGFSTLSSHEPWDVPVKRHADPVLNAFSYLDDCIGDFISKLRKMPQWEHTLVVLLPDHSVTFAGIDESDQRRNRIPVVWTGGAVREPRVVSQLCNQTDLPATLLAQLHLGHDEFRWSRDVMSRTYKYPFAVHNYNNAFSVVDSTGFVVYDLTARDFIVSQSADAARLGRMGKAILQATTRDLKGM